MKLLSIIAPAYNEAAVLPRFHARLSAVLDTLTEWRCEILYVNDGSRDDTLAVIQQLAAQDARVALLDLSRNFGKEVAMTAGLDHAQGDWVVLIDTDLQDPPELIPQLIEKSAEGYDTVYARRTHRKGESWLKRSTAAGFYRLIGRVSGRVNIPRDTGDFRLISRRVVEALKTLREQHRFMKGLYAWVGFPAAPLDYERDARAAGRSSFNYWKLWNFALEGITSYTTAPLRVATYLGFVVALAAFVSGLWIIGKTLIWGDPVRGYPSLMVAILFFGGVQLLFIGILGEYLGRIFGETKNRPLYLIQHYRAADAIGVEPTLSAAPLKRSS